MIIENVKIHSKKIIANKKGRILKYISKKDNFIKKFGEIYFSFIKKNKIKGWNYHKINKCFLMCVYGEVLVHIIDQRKSCKSYNKEFKLRLLPNKGKVLDYHQKLFHYLLKEVNNL